MELPGAFDRLRAERVWVAWADEEGRKVPKSPRGGNARTNDPSTWGTYEEALASASRNGYSGVGLMLTDGYIGIDLDGAVEDGAIADWAQEIIDHFGSYTELSPSGSGLHVVAWADPEYVGPVGRADRSAGIEIYNHGRYFTVTGESVSSAPIVDATQDVPAFIGRYFSGESPEEAMRRRVGNLARDQVKRQANRTMAENCARDGVRYARVPVGAETCGFCIMLASRGFVYTTPEAAAHAHDGCDCKVMPGFEGMEVEGYDPDSMYGLYAEARSRAEHPTDAEISREIERLLNERGFLRLGKRFGHVDGLPATEIVEGVRFDASDPEDVQRFIERYSDEIRGEPIEHAYVLQADGTVRHAVGTADAVSLEGVEMTGAIIVHNHPVVDGESVSFGRDDFDIMKEYPDIGAIYAVNDVYEYRATIESGFDGVIYNDGYAGVPIGSNDETQHLMMEWFSEQGYIDYRRRELRGFWQNR